MHEPRTFIVVLAAGTLALSGLACLSGAATPEVSVEEAWAATEAVLNLALTQQALGAIQTARALPTPTSPAPGAHSPEIISVDFPTTLRADGAYVRGSIQFVDAGFDVNKVSIETLEGSFASGTWDPTGTISWNGALGSLPFDSRCTMPQTIRARATLTDSLGSASIHSDFAFTCE